MELFLFASESLTNVWAGIGARQWAVRKTSDSDMKSRVTKSMRMKAGSLGLLYCNESQSFTTPFVVLSMPDASRIVTNVWLGEWHLPFRIHPLGSPDRQLHKAKATEVLQVLRESPNNVSATMNLTGTTVFVPKDISADDWALALGELAD
jgi:hypothetical protein